MKHYLITLLVAAAAVPPVAAAQAAGLDSSSTDSGSSEVSELSPADVRVVISVEDRQLWVLLRGDTVHSAPVAVASGRDFSYAGRFWRFATPRGELRVRRKRTEPVWLPPDWHYAEVAEAHKLKLRHLPRSGVSISEGRRLIVRDSIVGVVFKGDSKFYPLPVEEHIIFDKTLFIPPISTKNRRLEGELGAYALDLGNGYLLHGTTDKRSIGTDSTHGCIRLLDADLEWLYQRIPVGARVFVF